MSTKSISEVLRLKSIKNFVMIYLTADADLPIKTMSFQSIKFGFRLG